MTERSYFWTHGAGGDASYSPYDAAEFNMFHHMPVLGKNTTELFVVPSYLDDLEVRVSTDSAHSVAVKPGAALFNNYFYINDIPATLPIERAAGGKYRRDLIVLRLNTTDNKIRLAVVKGGEAATLPIEPSPTQLGAIWEVVLAVVFVAGDVSILPDNYITDRRKFLYTTNSHLTYGWKDNLLNNSEWFGSSLSDPANYSADTWDIIAPSTNLAINSGRAALTEGSGRGNWGVVDLNANLADFAGWGKWINAGSSKTYTVRGFLNVYTRGTDGFVVGLRGFDNVGTESSVYKEVRFLEYDAEDVPFQFTVTFPEDNIKTLFFYIVSEGSGQIADIGQLIVVPGYFPGYFRPIHELIMGDGGITDGSWDGDAKSTGATTINLSASFAGTIKNHTKALILRLRGRDSGSAAGTPSMNVQGYAAPFNAIYGTLILAGVTNDEWRETQVVVPVNQIYWGTGVAGAQFRINIVASGAGTFDAVVQIVGIIV